MKVIDAATTTPLTASTEAPTSTPPAKGSKISKAAKKIIKSTDSGSSPLPNGVHEKAGTATPSGREGKKCAHGVEDHLDAVVDDASSGHPKRARTLTQKVLEMEKGSRSRRT